MRRLETKVKLAERKWNQVIKCVWLMLSISSGHALPQDDERLVGWGGETFNPAANQVSPYMHYIAERLQEVVSHILRQAVNWQHIKMVIRPRSMALMIETISWKPRSFVFHNFLTMAECDHLVGIGERRVSRSLVVDAATGASKTDDIRTSFGAAFGRGEDPVIAGIEEKLAEWSHVPPDNGEPLQILRYVDGQKYDAHWDWFDDPVHHAAYLAQGNRFATVLLYLSDVVKGGETNLPLADAIDEAAQQLSDPSPCAARMGISVRPHKGDALLFFDMDPGGARGDRKALHASCPTTAWLHNKAFMGKFDALEAAARCTDIDSGCKQKVKKGECYNNPSMVGAGGVCRKSCEDCVDCPASDILCQRKNMHRSVKYNGVPT